MKHIIFLLAFSFSCLSAIGQSDNPKYDKALADSLGGDEYGMKTYIFVILKTGPAKIEDKGVLDSLFRGHMENIGRLASEGKLVLAGPFGKNDRKYRGLFILNAKTVEEANALLETDPTIRAKVFETEVTSWYGSAALPTYLPNHEKIEKTKI